MGCDIHIAVERKVGDKWVMVKRLEFGSNNRALIRNYGRFAALAGVRGEGPSPKGIPEDVSESTKLFIDDWGSDGHSHSWMNLAEAAKVFLMTDPGPEAHASEYPSDYYFDVYGDEENHRIVFFFDN